MRKRLLTIVLALVILLTQTVSVIANDGKIVTEEVTKIIIPENEVVCEYYSWRSCGDFMVIYFDSRYTEINEAVTIEFDLSDEKETETNLKFSDESVVQKIYEYEGETYPVIFVKITDDLGSKKILIKTINISKGAFRTADNIISEKVEIDAETQLKEVKIEFSRSAEKYFEEFRTDTIVKNSRIVTTLGIYSDYSKIWQQDINGYVESDAMTDYNWKDFCPKENGRYRIVAEVHSFVFLTYTFDVATVEDVYFENLGYSFRAVLEAPIAFILGIFVFLVPGLGTICGPIMSALSLEQIPKFFVDLFHIPKVNSRISVMYG